MRKLDFKLILRLDLKLLLSLFLIFFISGKMHGQTGATHMYTDYSGFWSSGQGQINTILPDNDHNLLAFKYNGIVYSTGVNNGILGANGISFTNTRFQAFPVKDIPLTNGGSVFAAYGKLRDNLSNAVGLPAPFSAPLQISAVLADGINGLNIGTGVTNIPSTTVPLTFNFGAITDPTQIGDGIPDIIVSQIAQASGALDQLYFEDGAGNLVGRVVSIAMDGANIPVLGNWAIDFYNPDGTNNTSQPCCNQTRPIRIWAADAADFGISAANFSTALVLRYKLNGSSDPAFLAFNTAFIQIVSVNDDVASTNENTPVNINVLANDQPVNGLDVNSMVVTQQPANGTVSVNTVNGVRVITYTPNLGFTGTDTFRYQVCNGATVPQCDDAMVTVNVGSADVMVTKEASTLSPAIGGEIEFTITAHNNGPNTANDVVVRDVLPAGYEFILDPSSDGYDVFTGNWAIGVLPNAATRVIKIKARVKVTGPYTNTATITTKTLDPVESNNSSTVTPVPVLSTDLAVTKLVSSLTPKVGDNVSFTITAKNNGPSNATGVAINDLLPAGYVFQSATAAVGTTYNALNGIWTIGNLTSGTATTPITLTVLAKVVATGSYANKATIYGAQTDPVVGNNEVTVIPIPVPQADLAVTKTISPTSADVNTNVVFTINVTNNGPSTAVDAIVNDLLPNGYDYVSSTATVGTYNSVNGNWIVGSLINNATAALTITAKVKSNGIYQNIASTNPSVSTTADPVNTNNSATASPIVAPVTDLKVTKTALKDVLNNAGTVNPGDVETFTITVTNNGPSSATGIIATDQLPSGYSFVSAVASVGAYVSTTGLWNVGNLTSGASATLTINATILATGNYTNAVNVVGTEKDPDLSNNEAYAPSASTSADIRIAKTLSSPSAYVDDFVTFTLKVTNDAASISDATQVTVTDLLPSGYEYDSSNASIGTYNSVNGIWYVGNLIKGNSATLNIIAKVKPSGNYENVATAVAAQTDPNVANNSDRVLVTPLASADLLVVKTLNNASLNSGNAIFTIQVTNNGSSTATNVTVNDALPSGYTFSSYTASTGNYTGGVWTVGNLASGTNATLTINATLNASGVYLNTAEAFSTTRDPNTSNNKSSAQPAPLAPTGSASQTFCQIADAKVSNLVVTGTNIKWYANAVGGSPLTPAQALFNNGKYYASQTIAATESVNRFEVTVTITATPAPTTTAATQTFCEIANARISNLVVSGTNVVWYGVTSGGTALPQTTVLVNNAIYYASQTLNGCESKTRVAVTVKVTEVLAPTGNGLQTFCEVSNATIADLVTNATGLVKWYENALSTVALASTRALVNNETYYATQTLNGCESATRLAVKVGISIVTAPAAAAAQTFCLNQNDKVGNLGATGSSISWYAVPSGGSPLVSTASLINGQTYYASQVVSGCESKTRTAVTVTILNSLKPTLAPNQSFCATVHFSLEKIIITGANIKWYADALSTTALPNTTLLVNGNTYYATQTVAGGCESDRIPVTVKLENCVILNPSIRSRANK